STQAQVDGIKRRRQSLEQQIASLDDRRKALARQVELKAEETRMRDEARARVSAAKAKAEQARVALAEAQLALDRMTVRAPTAGRVLRLIAAPGARVMPGVGHTGGHDASTVVTLYQPDSLEARVDVRFDDLAHVTR